MPKVRRPNRALSAPRSTEMPFFDPITGMSWAPADPFICFAEGDPPGDPPPGDPPQKTFSQEDVDRIVTQRLAKAEKKYSDYDQLKEQAGQVPELSKQLDELKEKLELAGKDEKEKEKLLAEKLHAKTEREKAELEAKLQEAQAQAEKASQDLLTTVKKHHLTTALTSAKALPGALKHAVPAFMSEAEVEVDESGEVVSVTLDDVPYSDLGKAAEAYLKGNPHFAAATTGGGGSRNPNGAPSGKDWKELPPDEIANLAWNSEPTGQRGPDPQID